MMELICCENSLAYENLTKKNHFHPYNSSAFIELNRHKCEKIHYLVFTKKDSPRLSLILGQNQEKFVSPFSAPFGGFDFLSKEPTTDVLNECLALLKTYLLQNKAKTCTMVLPPLLYDRNFLAKCANSLLVNGLIVRQIDVNHFMKVKNCSSDHFIANFTYAARKNFNKSLKSDFIFRVNEDKAFSESYEIIQKNRQSKGYHLFLSLDDVRAVSQLIPIDSFVLSLGNGQNIASAIVYRLSDQVVQVIYWGHHPDFSTQNPMNFLAFKIFEYYAQQGFDVVDIGPSSSESVVSLGLSNFKESLGCGTDLKLTFELSL